MSQENLHDQNWDHRQWLKFVSDVSENAQEFAAEVWETFRILFDRGLTRAVKEIKFFLSKSTLFDFICGGLNAVFGFFATLIFLSGFCLIGYQVILWLNEGVWTEFPLAVVFNYLFENTALHSWVADPGSWLGLQKVVAWSLENIPLSAALIIPGFILTSALAGIMTGAILIRYYQFKKVEKD